ncbi:MAG TPA: hypothetical protein VGM37_06010 [Armatimonadota bacterium]|jgi:type III secretory pathway component EscS
MKLDNQSATPTLVMAISGALGALLIASKVLGSTGKIGLPLFTVVGVLVLAGVWLSRMRLRYASLTLVLRNRDCYADAFSRVPADLAAQTSAPLLRACRVLGQVESADVLSMRLEAMEWRRGADNGAGMLRRLATEQRAALPGSVGGTGREGVCIVSLALTMSKACPLTGSETDIREVRARLLNAPLGSLLGCQWFFAPMHGGEDADLSRLMSGLPHLAVPSARR